jgi:uroporphyrinogen-III synthase
VHPLLHQRILITRSRHQASDLVAQLEALGAIPILIPTIEIVPPETCTPLDNAISQLETYNWLLFTSANAVEVFAQRLSHLHDIQSGRVPNLRDGFIIDNVGHRKSDPYSARNAANPQRPQIRMPLIAVIGPATARAVQSIGLTVDLMPPQYTAESLAESLLPTASGKSFLFPRAAEARDHLPEALTSAGATVTIAEAYRNRTPPESITAIKSLFAAPEHYPDAITFTSASTARNLFALLETANLKLPPNITLASIGPITSQTLRDLGHPPNTEATEPTIPALIESLLISPHNP